MMACTSICKQINSLKQNDRNEANEVESEETNVVVLEGFFTGVMLSCTRYEVGTSPEYLNSG